MKRNLVPLLAVPALLAFSTDLGQDVRFGPSQGLTLTKTFSTYDETSMDEIAVVMNGQEQDAGMSDMDQTTTSALEVVLVDEYGPVANGRPTRLKRTYETISSTSEMEMAHPMMGEMSMSMTGESELEGQTVLFTWNAEDGVYDVSFAEDNAGDEALLEDLTEDTDLRGVLPTSSVAEGDTWEIAANTLRDVLAFGGALKIDVEMEGDEAMMGGMGGNGQQPTPDQFLGELEGSVMAEYRGNREHAGEQVAVIHLAVDVAAAKDMTDFFVAATEAAELPEGMEMQMEYHSVDMEFEFEGTAIVLWSLDGGHLVSLEMSGDTRTTMDMDMSMDMGMGDMSLQTTVQLSGKQTTTLTVESSSAE